MRSLSLIVLLPLLGCKKEEPETPYEVEDGAYTVTFLSTWEGAECGYQDVFFNFDPAATTITTTETSMELSFDEGDATLSCSREINDVSCEPVEFFQDPQGGGNTVVTVSFGIEGAWRSETTFSGTYTHAFDCEGERCDNTSYGTDAIFPCELDGELEATRD